ncbi:uncharacterized protein LOC111050410 isoform X2 [Nilaparvata lugens]|uniref:uncharacterized protein LOC111050410 isoform X2 n=1 Tax=Nilaparvata lugens TaxID=108931 RepID=UPI00193D1DB8|nr:uncharacterized protein LOC111050410 isoform X2 [Nilaparvata lugens]
MVECSGTAKLIEAVKEHPMLYDLCNENYRNKVVTNKKWMEIGDLLDIHGTLGTVLFGANGIRQIRMGLCRKNQEK